MLYKNYLLDTTAIIEILRGNKNIKKLIERWLDEGNNIHYSILSVYEVYSGMREGEENGVKAFFEGFSCCNLTPSIAKLAGDWTMCYRKKGITISGFDALIGATAYINKCILVTANVKHYPMLEQNQIYKH
ncbi:type II toxin-antitoxin system VapC family toxin [Thermoanaerobacterium sp. DL9XJH110]|uniref:type II toxin-antitoxin system VapC family toxin n=1 Tax=Thermoanaerobacterium sp. DL9XJH110 TaxID=3386643 RepID=UPI003BB69500